MNGSSRRGQSMVEFALTIGMVMFLVIATAQLAILLHDRSSLDLATREGAYEGSLVGHGPADAIATTRQLWAKLEPGGRQLQVQASRQGNLIVVDAKVSVPALFPIPYPPYTSLVAHSHSVHTIEVFQPGSAP
jgi:Flp pilus assembly protein TadG